MNMLWRGPITAQGDTLLLPGGSLNQNALSPDLQAAYQGLGYVEIVKELPKKETK